MNRTLSLVTGGSRGIGRAIATELSKKGSRVLIASKDNSTLIRAGQEIAAETKGDILTFECDLSSESGCETLANHCIKMGLVPNILVLNAGVFLEGTLTNSSSEDYRKTLDVNLNSSYYLVKRLAQQMKSLSNPKIVLIGSTAAYEPYPVGALYGVAKWALRGYAVNLRRELTNDGIGVTFISPGGTLTDLWAGEVLPAGRLLEPRDIGIIVSALLDLSSQAVVEEIVIRPMLGDMHE